MERIYYFFIPYSPLKNFFLLCFSMNVFKVLGFDPHTMQSSQPVGGPSPPQDALVFLSKLSSTISQLLQAFSRYLGPFISVLSVIPPSVLPPLLWLLCHSCLHICSANFWTKTQWKDCIRQPMTSASRWRQLATLFRSYRKHEMPFFFFFLNSQHLSPASAGNGLALLSGSQQVQMTRSILQSDYSFMTLKSYCSSGHPVIYWTT